MTTTSEVSIANKIRWGILGCGSIAGKFADALKHVKEAELVAVGSRTEDKAHAFADTYRVHRRYGNYAKLAEDSDLDIIYIATPHHLHAETALLCLRAGKHVLCEKPLAVNARQGLDMITCARKTKRFLMEAMWTRFLPLMDKVRRLLAQEAIGSLHTLTADFGFRCKPNTQRLIDPHLAGGALLDVGIYPLALSFMIFGKPLHIHSTAILGPTGVDEKNAVILTFEHGQLAMLSSAFTVETTQEAVIIGSEGMIRLNRPWWRGNTITLVRHGQDPQQIEAPSHQNGFIYEIQAVHHDLAEGRIENTLMPLDESLSILQTMDTIRKQWGLQYPFETE
ncbi:MAG: Gfo/Idh/MocA family oxidoreductase [Sedimentisphaerales bacterium]|nr:Gfo/Idh/MocA family oxidoreductase [Sedimentisphaerales bacterium]